MLAIAHLPGSRGSDRGSASSRSADARRKRIGRRGERVAARHIRRSGLRILARNIHCGGGEIDIVAVDGDTLVFVEVKTRTAASWCEGLQRIGAAKRRRLRRACRAYLCSLPLPVYDVRVDGVAVELESRRWRLKVVDIVWSTGILSIRNDD